MCSNMTRIHCIGLMWTLSDISLIVKNIEHIGGVFKRTAENGTVCGSTCNMLASFVDAEVVEHHARFNNIATRTDVERERCMQNSEHVDEYAKCSFDCNSQLRVKEIEHILFLRQMCADKRDDAAVRKWVGAIAEIIKWFRKMRPRAVAVGVLERDKVASRTGSVAGEGDKSATCIANALHVYTECFLVTGIIRSYISHFFCFRLLCFDKETVDSADNVPENVRERRALHKCVSTEF